MPRNVDSVVLESVKVHCGSDYVNITCLFRNDRSPTQQCVIVICKLTESLLMVKHFSMDTAFPVNLLLSEPGNYTVAVFGWSDGMIESLPAHLQQADITGISKGNHPQVPLRHTHHKVYLLKACICFDADTSTQELPTASSFNNEAQMNRVLVVTSSVVVGIFLLMVVVAVILVAVVVYAYRRRKLGATTSFNHDPLTQPNLAYELHKPRKRAIPVQQNIAYEHSTLPSNTATL